MSKTYIFKVSKDDDIFIEGTFSISASSKKKAKKKFRRYGVWTIKSIEERYN